MPKLIAPRRTNKNVTVDEFWAIRSKFAKSEEQVQHNYREDEVAKRHRFMRLRDQIKAFNPLEYYLLKDQDFASEHKTHTHAYLESIAYRLPEEIMTVKSLMFGLASILQNVGEIYTTLWDHLDSDDCWKLMQTLLKDTREESYKCWIKEGLEKIVGGLGNDFKESRFKSIFNTLCLLMEVCFDKISENEESVFQFLEVLGQNYFRNKNKYIRKFSLKCISYVMSNIEEQIFYKFVSKMIQNSENELYQHFGDILAQRLKYSDGCLTPNSLQELITLVETLKQMNLAENVLTIFVSRVLANLEEKRIHEENQTLFDLTYIIKAFLELGSNNKLQPECIISGIDIYLNQTIHQKHAKPRRLQEASLIAISNFLWEHLGNLSQSDSTYNMLALSFKLPLNNISNIRDFLLKEKDEDLVLNFLSMIDEEINKEISMLLISSFKTYLQTLLCEKSEEISESNILIAYKILLLSKKHSISLNFEKMFSKKIDFKKSIQQLTHLHKTGTIANQRLYEHTLVFLRILTIIELPKSLKSVLVELLNESVKNYYEVLKGYFKQVDSSSTNIFDGRRYVEQIFLYSHSTVPFVWEGFNVIQSFIEIEKKIGETLIDRSNENYSLWQRIVVNRISICNEIQNVLSQGKTNYLFTLQSRHRQIRYMTLQHLKETKLFQNHEFILQKILSIDEDIVDLETERTVKMMLLEMLRYLQKNQLPAFLNEILLCWCLGFAFTGMKTIEESFATFLSALLEIQEDIKFETLIGFVEYYTFRNSRVYELQIQKFYSKNESSLSLPDIFKSLTNSDFENSQIETTEFIGVDRVALAISKSQKVKTRLGNSLINILDQYFKEEFVRHKSVLSEHQAAYKSESGEVNQLLQPPKTTFLKQILKLVPGSYQPPLECLHYTKDYLKLESVLKTKRQQWQIMWDKKTKFEHNRIMFQNMSHQQMQMYIHFLWGELLKADANKLRVIIEHVRDYMNQKVTFFVEIYFRELTLGVTDEEKLKTIFGVMDSRKLLTFIYILKAIVKALRNYIRDHFDSVIEPIMIMMEMLEPSISTEMEDEGLQQQNEGEVSEQSEDEVVENSPNSKFKKFKNHRKQIYKILNSLVTLLADEMPISSVDHILQIFDRQNKLQTFGKVSLNSTPGLLLFLKQLSKHKKYHSLFMKYKVFDQLCIIFRGVNTIGVNGSLNASVEILRQVLSIKKQNEIVDEKEESSESVIKGGIEEELLNSIYDFLASFNKFGNELTILVLQIVLELSKISLKMSQSWQKYLLLQINRIVIMKTSTESNKTKLFHLIKICLSYSTKMPNNEFLLSMMVFIPQLKQVQHRKLIANSISEDIRNNKQKIIRNVASDIVTDLNSTIDGGLVQQVDFPAFFKGTSLYKEQLKSFNIQEHQFLIYNLLAYVTSPELSVRKAVQTCLQHFLSIMNRENRDLVSKLFRIISEQLKKPYNGQEHIFWGIFSCLGFFTRWVIKNDLDHAHGYEIFGKSIALGQINENDIFQQFSAIAQSKKMDGLKSLRALLKNEETILQNRIGDKYPNLLTGIFLPVLEHFILPPPTPNSRFEMVANLTTSLAHVSLEVYEFAMKRGGESLQKKQLKRMVAKLKFDEEHMKKNVTIVKVISQITESINLPKVSETISKTIKENGMEEFHKKLVEKKSRKSNIRQPEEDDSEDEILKRKAFRRINNEIEDDELINMGFLNLDKKIMQFEDEQNPIDIEEPMVKFLKTHVLSPLKTMLMFENKNKKKNSQEESDKSRMFLSIVVTKIIMRFPVEVFMNELQKIISRLGRLLKQRQMQIRENARKCFAQIAKLIGADMLYVIFREFKFHLRDNFQNHILNYSIYYILQKFGPLHNGAIDYCLPIILPSIIDELFGKSGAEKEMVDQGIIPVINMESRKKKANDLLIIVCKQISVQKIDYLVKYFDKFLLEYINSEANISKYEQMLTNMIGGLSKNDQVMDVSNSNTFIETLHDSIQKLKSKIKLYQFEDPGFHHESTLRQNIVKGSKKTGREVLEIQEEAGRNASIFKKQAKQIQERRNNELLVGCFMQFYLSLLSLLIKKKIINQEQENEKFDSIITFIVECVSHRDNRIVHRCLKVIHNVIHWKKMKTIMQIRKKTSRKIFTLIQKLTSADEDLIRQCFTILNDLFQQINITSQVLHVLLTIIKLHITTVEKTIAEQPYKLLKTVLVKISNDPNLILDNAVYELYEYSRATLISTSLDHIRNVCREICCIYIKQQKQPDTGGRKNKNKSHVHLDFNQEVSFYLNNIDCKWSETQSAVLDILKTYVTWHSKPEIEETGEVIIMSLGTAYANDQDNHHKLTQLIKQVADKIDNSKILSLMEKCLIWSSNHDQEAISVCGFFILSSLLKAKGNLLNETKLTAIAEVCGQILKRQENNFLIYEEDMKEKQTQYETLKNNPEWEGIIETDDVSLKVEKNYQSATQILSFLLQSYNLIKKSELQLLWRLVSAPSEIIHSKAGQILVKLPSITKIIGEPITSASKQEDKSIKTKILEFVKSAKQVDSLDFAIQIAQKVIEETKEIQGIVGLLESLILGLINRISKSIVTYFQFS